MEDCTAHMGYIDFSARMADSQNIANTIWKWMKKFIQVLWGSMTDLQFKEQMVRGLAVLFHKGDIEVCGMSRGQPSSSEAQMS
jgi:hypothetical protein